MWNSIFYLIMVPMVYAAFAILFGGLLLRIIILIAAPRFKGKLGTYPRSLPRPIGVAKDAFLVPAAFRTQKLFWLFIIIFHAAFVLLIIGHLELIREFSIIQIVPHQVFLGGGFVGIALIVATLYFLFRRFGGINRQISVPEDYIMLLLLFLTMIFGSHMNLAAQYGFAGFDVPVKAYREYTSSLLALTPVLPPVMTGSPHYVLIVMHVFFANLFLMLFPFSKMVHSVFAFITHNLTRG